jgi:hypothetical protein
MLLTCKQIISYLFMIVCCSEIYLIKAMEEPIAKRRRIEVQQEQSLSSFESLPSELKFYIISFLVNEEYPEKAIESIKALSQTSKYFGNFINDPSVLGNLIKEISNQFGKNPIDIAIGFRNRGAANWIKDRAEQYPQEKELVHQQLIQAARECNKGCLEFLFSAVTNVTVIYYSMALYQMANK